ncbi:ATP-binding protein [Aquimonas sp.]|jgi:two-component system sensor histidine kinase PilS (NtrC family)|uniref:ATP-binding protein n=1 Tax=Aquimonas sp. TaxID=1872588 RepID=UPI0037C0C5DA
MSESEDGPQAGQEDSGDHALRRELYFFTLYRALEGALLVFVVFSPVAANMVHLEFPLLAQAAAICHLVAGLVLVVAAGQLRLRLPTQAALGLSLDIAIALLFFHVTDGIDTAIGLMMLVNIGAGALLLSLRSGLALAAVMAAGGMGEFLLTQLGQPDSSRDLVEAVMLAISYLAVAVLCHQLGRQMRETSQLAAQRGLDLANLAQLNELIIRRMRTGVLVVDASNQLQLSNEAAWNLLGQPSPTEQYLGTLSPTLSRRLADWQRGRPSASEALQLGVEGIEVIPRFAKLSASDGLVLIFLDDATLVSRRAEELTLSTLGRLSASIAHEVRNPLAAISYSAQLLEESPDLPATDRRLVEIILSHCQRMNGIIENVLNLSRRERSRPEQVDLSVWVQGFVDDYLASHVLERDQLIAAPPNRRLYAVVDPAQLHQAVTVLVTNALNYGRTPGQPARVTVSARQPLDYGPPVVEVTDRGPGIPAKVAANIFEPFFTTHEHGTGLGLYIARQLCEANQAALEYISVPAGGACFRITLAKSRSFGTPGTET